MGIALNVNQRGAVGGRRGREYACFPGQASTNFEMFPRGVGKNDTRHLTPWPFMFEVSIPSMIVETVLRLRGRIISELG